MSGIKRNRWNRNWLCKLNGRSSCFLRPAFFNFIIRLNINEFVNVF